MNAPNTRATVILVSLAVIALVLPGAAVAQSAKEAKCDNSTVEDFSPSLGSKARAFLANLKASVEAGDRQRIAGMARYPLHVSLNGRQRLVRSGSELVKDYDHLFTSSMREAIVMQIPECLFANWQGVMIGSGKVWFEEDRHGVMKIKTLNVPEH